MMKRNGPNALPLMSQSSRDDGHCGIRYTGLAAVTQAARASFLQTQDFEAGTMIPPELERCGNPNCNMDSTNYMGQ
ncbi:unnamed protein product [Fusarium venenatum]|uniref:Uncharacterized protein n=1 Tax=Fusarium venenatum TaxID=56646 RepID=A0A2L2TGE5_9HYPO|nr:uncharacterized protein FVRRES_09116 [Fusarium venenatum]CEI69039.1 unnamed protein product [Fusarium venenatum]